MRRRGRSVEVVDAKFAVDLATAQTYSENVFLFVPNLIGVSSTFASASISNFLSSSPYSYGVKRAELR